MELLQSFFDFEFGNIHKVVLWTFGLAIIFGAVVAKTNFCTMGAISDWVNMGDKGRFRAWMLATGIAIVGSQILQANVEHVNLTKSIYLSMNFGWLGALFGGFTFGVGMTLGSGCGQRTLVRVGMGNIKSLIVMVTLGIFALMTLTGFIALFRINWVEKANIDLTESFAMKNQGFSDLLMKIFPFENIATAQWILAAIFGGGLILFAILNSDFRKNFNNILAGVTIGLVIIGGWYITGALGFDDFEPIRLESFSFVAPIGNSINYLTTFTGSTINFGIAAVLGVIAGAFLYAIFSGNFRWEHFTSRNDLFSQITGGALMGVGGVLSLGCTIGQGVTGMSTLAMGSLLALVAIIYGCALTMKVQYYMIDGQKFFSALGSALKDLMTFKMMTT
ncbi:MAG: YeeE/YedE family protein [Gammaproteobacteria bacterium]|nr:MAG: YeeE/YedE family protein [Gammaproteobacteria bacterium]